MPRKSSSTNDRVVSAAAPPRRKPASPKHAKHSASPAETPEPAAAAAVCQPSQDEIARLAHSYWEARGFAGGSSEEDWLRAERELRGN
jgi:hypothetical protein